MAILARGVDQSSVHLAGITRLTPERILGRGKTGKLHLVDSWYRCLFYRCLGTGVEMALSAWSYQEDSHENDFPDCNDRVYGKQRLPRACGRGIASCDP